MGTVAHIVRAQRELPRTRTLGVLDLDVLERLRNELPLVMGPGELAAVLDCALYQARGALCALRRLGLVAGTGQEWEITVLGERELTARGRHRSKR